MNGSDHNGSDDESDKKNTTNRFPLLDRREYLMATGALTGAGVASTGFTTANQRGDRAGSESEDLRVKNPRVGYQTSPNNVFPGGESESSHESPRFMWEVVGHRGVSQSAFQILVASGSDLLNESQADVWDSGKVESDNSTSIEYAGPSLKPDTTYHWGVRIWTNEGTTSDWSTSTFTTAIPDTTESWEGEWIGKEHSTPNNSRPGEDWTDYTLDVDFTLLRESIGFAFRAVDESNLYLWQIDDDTLHLRVRENGDWSTLGEADVGDAFEGEDRRQNVRIQVRGEQISTWINGEKVDVTEDGTFSSGTIGFVQDWNEDIRVHSVTVTDLNDEELFSDDFDHTLADHFDGGAIREENLALRGNHIVLLGEAHGHPAPLLRREFEVERTVESARVHVCGLGFYELSLNGEIMGDRVLDPGRTNYEETILYSTYDVTDALQDGRNALGVTLGRGRFGELIENEWEWEEVPWVSEPQLLLQLNIDFDDGSSKTIVSDEDWTVTESPIQFDSLYEGEIYDARQERPEWSMPGYDDGEWNRPTVADAPEGDLVPQHVQPITVSDTLTPIERTEPKDGVYVFDMGVLISGWTELTVSGPEGTQVKLVHGEKLRDDGRVNNDNNSAPLPIQRDAYSLRGDGVEQWEPKFTYHGFRYVQIEGFPGEPTLDSIRAKVVHTAIDDGVENDFECSNDLLNQIHTNTRRAYLNNMHSVPTDSPTYEKNGWTGDALVTAETGMYNFDMARFWRKWLRDCRDAQDRSADIGAGSGNLPVIVPSSGFGYDDYWTPDPGWQSALVLVPWWGYEIYGDKRLLEENYEAITQYLDYLSQYADGHIIREGLGDWAAPGGRWPPAPAPDIISTCFYYRDVQVAAQAAEVLGYEDDAVEYQRLGDRIRTALNEKYLDEDAGYYRSRERDSDGWLDEYRQTDNVLPLAFEMVPEEHVDAVVSNLVHDVMETQDGHLNTGLHGTKYLLPVLSEYGHHDAAYTVATQTEYPSWGNWVKNDRTALLELWSIENSRSYSHHFLGSIGEWFYKHLAGIQVEEPGFEHMRIAPKPAGDLEWASGKIETVRGVVESNWELVGSPGNGRAGREMELEVTIPGNTNATVEIPTLGGEKVRIRENGKPIWNNGNQMRPNHAGIESVEQDGDVIAVNVGSGDYEFELERIGR